MPYCVDHPSDPEALSTPNELWLMAPAWVASLDTAIEPAAFALRGGEL